jgi:hypothetical protein
MSQRDSKRSMDVDVEYLDDSEENDEVKQIVLPHGPPVMPGPPAYVPPQGPPAPPAPQGPPVQPIAPAGEAWLRKPNLGGMVNEWLHYDAMEQQMLRQNSGVSSVIRAVYNPAQNFRPSKQPQLAPIANPQSLENQIQQICGQFKGVEFDEETITTRRAFLGRVDKQAKDLLAATTTKIALWNRQKVEFESLAEYDAEVQRLRAEKKVAETMLGEKRKRRRQSKEERQDTMDD